MKDVIQKQVTAGTETTFQMKLTRSRFLVKNFTEDRITVRLGENSSVSTIGAGCYETVFNNIDERTSMIAEKTNTVKVTAKAAGLVEVASID